MFSLFEGKQTIWNKVRKPSAIDLPKVDMVSIPMEDSLIFVVSGGGSHMGSGPQHAAEASHQDLFAGQGLVKLGGG